MRQLSKNGYFNKILVVLMLTGCGGSGSANARAPFYGTPDLSDFGNKKYLLNNITELADVIDVSTVARLASGLNDKELCSYTLGEEQLYNPYRHLSLSSGSWIFSQNLLNVDYKFVPTAFNHRRVDYWKRDGSIISKQSTDCYSPSAWRTRSPRVELGVHPFVKKYSDCLLTGFPDPSNIDNCQDGMESIGGLTHRVRSATINRHRFRVSWWLKKPTQFEEELQKIREALKIPFRINIQIDSIYSELSDSDDYRVRAMAFAKENDSELPRYWLISDEAGRGRLFLPLTEVTLSQEATEARAKLKEINRPELVANLAGHFAWDRVGRVQKKSSQLPVSRFMDDLVYDLWKGLREGSGIKVFIVFRGQDSDDVYLEEFLLENSGNLTFKKISQLNAYGLTTMGLPNSSEFLDANGLEIYND